MKEKIPLFFLFTMVMIVLVICAVPASAAGDNETPASTKNATPTQPLPAYITITSDPSGADISFDGEDIGKTPLAGHVTTAGTHKITVSRDGYKPATKTVELQSGEQGAVSLTLEAVPTETPTTEPTTATPTPTTATPTATLTVTPTKTATPVPTPGIGWYVVRCNVDGAEVYFDGKYMGLITGGSLSVEYRMNQAPYSTIRVSKSGYTTVTQSLPQPPGPGGKTDVYITLQSGPSASGTLTIYSTPSGGSVYIDKKYKGTTPFSISLSPGTYGVQVDKSGYSTTAETVIMSAGQTITRSYKLQPKSSYGSLMITSDPDNAYAYIDGSYAGTTALTVRNLAEGDHRIRLTAPGYNEWTTTQYVKAGAVMTVHGTLTPSASDKGYIRVVSYPGEAEVYLDGKYMGKTNDEGVPGAYTMTVNPGTYKVSVELTGYRDYEQTVAVGTGQTQTVDANLVLISEPVPGEISISSTPSGANVFVDDEYKGITPVTIPGVASGTRDVLLRLPGYADADDKVNVPPGGTATVSVSMKPEGEAKATPGFGFIAAISALGISGLVISRRKGLK